MIRPPSPPIPKKERKEQKAEEKNRYERKTMASHSPENGTHIAPPPPMPYYGYPYGYPGNSPTNRFGPQGMPYGQAYQQRGQWQEHSPKVHMGKQMPDFVNQHYPYNQQVGYQYQGFQGQKFPQTSPKSQPQQPIPQPYPTYYPQPQMPPPAHSAPPVPHSYQPRVPTPLPPLPPLLNMGMGVPPMNTLYHQHANGTLNNTNGPSNVNGEHYRFEKREDS